MKRVAGAAVPVLLAGASLAQGAGEALPPVRARLQDAGGEAAVERGCIGVFADACMAAPGGETAVGMSGCLVAEAGAWDVLLNETCGGIVAGARRLSEAQKADGVQPVARVEMLRAAQRAWIAFRDADCACDVAFWGQGNMRQIAGSLCALDRTAGRVVELREKLRAYSQ